MTMSDDAFLNYVLSHSATPRHAFHRNDVVRLMELAGVDEIATDNCGLPNFYGVDEHESERLVELARAKMKPKMPSELSSTCERKG
jgi:hypothetical protein